MLSDFSENYATGCPKKETRMDSTTFSKIGLIVLSGCVWNLVSKGCDSQFSGETLQNLQCVPRKLTNTSFGNQIPNTP